MSHNQKDEEMFPIAEAAVAELEESVQPVRERFEQLAWKTDTLLLSSITEMAMHPAYQQIIGMGKEALPLLFAEFRREPDHWFWALQAITGLNPVPITDRGNVDKMAQV